MVRIHIVYIEWDDEHINKLKRDHGLEVYDVDEAIVRDPDRRAKWVSSQKHGRRLMVTGYSECHGKAIIAFLDPVNEREGIRRIRTAWEVRPGETR
ncbi:MAG: hypothetical protein KKF41_05505 [Actinobacteria bacterium]|nr:hypothetical protein [Actinomycetota bacterium]MBU1944102.1 hypothetical protein [Actinomycetota bacterium]MBU2687022.1 hypothetical protein [Actinomycetota bacterium]